MLSPYSSFRDRHTAGVQLAEAVVNELNTLSPTQRSATLVVYGLPRGGLPVAEPIATALGCPLDIIVAKKITLPKNPELAIGAVTADGHIIRSRQECFFQHRSDTWRTVRQDAQTKAQMQLQYFAAYRPGVDPKGAIALVVDDGIATGMTMAVAARALRARAPAQVWLCAPVAPQRMVRLLKAWGDRVIVLLTPERFFSVSRFYTEFGQVEMEEALACLERQNRRLADEWEV